MDGVGGLEGDEGAVEGLLEMSLAGIDPGGIDVEGHHVGMDAHGAVTAVDGVLAVLDGLHDAGHLRDLGHGGPRHGLG